MTTLNISSLLNTNPPYQFMLFKPLLLFFIGVLLLAILLPFFPLKTWQKSVKRVVTPLWVLGLGGLSLLFARNQSIQYLSTPIILLVFLLVSFLFFGYSLRVALKEIVKSKGEHLQAQRFGRYLPKPKRKS